MNWFTKLQTLSPTDAWLADVAIQFTALLAIVLLLHLGLRGNSASRRHALLTAAALSIPLLFLLSHVLPEWRLISSPSAAVEASVEPIKVSFEETIIGGSATAAAVGAVSNPAVSETSSNETASGGITSPWFMIWIVGVTYLWLKLARGVFALARIKKHGSEFSDPALTKLFAEEVADLGLRRTPTLLKLKSSAMPMTWGLRSHVVALPPQAAEWGEEKARRVIRHELAHVARRDCLTGWSASACFALLWFLPLTWLIRSASMRAREAACDDLALRASGSSERDAYARDLIDIIGSHSRKTNCPGMAIAFAMGAGHRHYIQQRLAAILDEKRNRRGLNLRLVLLSAPIWLALVAAFATLATLRPIAHADEPESKTISKSGPPVTHSYPLVSRQIANLVPNGVNWDRVDDPFASRRPSEPDVVEIDLDTCAAEARNSLVTRFGIPISSGDPVKISFENRYKLKVVAPAGIQKAIAGALDSMLNSAQIKLKMHVFEIDDPAWLAKQLPGADTTVHSAGVIEPEQFEKLRKAIGIRRDEEAHKMMPSVVARGGQRAKLEMIDEFIYPTKYDPPELPKDFKPDPDGNGSFPVTPANPTAFDVRNVGLTWEVEPILRVDGSVGMAVAIEDVQFLGFINYGTPINAAVRGLIGQRQVTLTDNRILQPVFNVSKISTEFVIPAGKFVAINGFAHSKQNAAMGAVLENVPGDLRLNLKRANGPALEKRKNRLFVIEAEVIPAE